MTGDSQDPLCFDYLLGSSIAPRLRQKSHTRLPPRSEDQQSCKILSARVQVQAVQVKEIGRHAALDGIANGCTSIEIQECLTFECVMAPTIAGTRKPGIVATMLVTAINVPA